ncbi:MAG: CHC2 zinc finger domain-containing protein [Desulfovibrionales bacterium]|nr:CHC2 zinc finger domain-containing protein [Desulfovibrionales bacterium]
MGVAMQLHFSDRERIARSILTDSKPLKDGKYIPANCPFHEESTKGGAFFYNVENDTSHCFGCPESADLVGIFNAVHGRAFDDGDGFREFVATYLNDSVHFQPQERKKLAAVEQPKWQAPIHDMPPKRWSEKAEEFVFGCMAALQDNEEQLAKLAEWGISPEVAHAARIGYFDAKGERDDMAFRKFSNWGLPKQLNAKGNEKSIYLPKGLVFCGYRLDGNTKRIARMHIRCDNAGKPWYGDKKLPSYVQVIGGNAMYYIFGKVTARIWVIVETVRDAILLWQELGHYDVSVMAIGGASNRPDAQAHKCLMQSELIVNAMDADEAGRTNSWKYDLNAHGQFAWQVEYPQCIRWPVPKCVGKDVGDLPKSGLSVWDWFTAGLPDNILRRVEGIRDRKLQQMAAAQQAQQEAA